MKNEILMTRQLLNGARGSPPHRRLDLASQLGRGVFQRGHHLQPPSESASATVSRAAPIGAVGGVAAVMGQFRSQLARRRAVETARSVSGS